MNETPIACLPCSPVLAVYLHKPRAAQVLRYRVHVRTVSLVEGSMIVLIWSPPSDSCGLDEL